MSFISDQILLTVICCQRRARRRLDLSNSRAICGLRRNIVFRLADSTAETVDRRQIQFARDASKRCQLSRKHFDSGIGCGKSRWLAPTPGPAIKDMGTHSCDFGQIRLPVRNDPDCVIMRRCANRSLNITCQCCGGYSRCPAPSVRIAGSGEGSVTSEAKLAPGRSLGTLKHDAANRMGIGRVSNPIKDNLRNRPLAFTRFRGRLIIYGRRQAVERSHSGSNALRTIISSESRGGQDWACKVRHRGVQFNSPVRRNWLEGQDGRLRA